MNYFKCKLESIFIRLIVFIICFVFLDYAWAQNVISLHGGIVIPEDEAFYMDVPVNRWYDREIGFIFGGQIYRKISSTFMIGLYGEYETINLSRTGIMSEVGSRIGAGLTYLGRIPEDLPGGVGFELGGTIGAGFASLPFDLDSQIGIDFGAFMGPVVRISPTLHAAIHFVGSYGWYGGGDVPEGVQNVGGRLRGRLYFNF